MNELPVRYKIFKAICIVQMLLVTWGLILSIIQLFAGRSGWHAFLYIICYSSVFIFLWQGLSLLHNNYPDTPLTQQQKRKFNLLFLLNFVMIALLFAEVVRNWWILSWFINSRTLNLNMSRAPLLWMTLLIPMVTFVIHFVFLVGMYSLRRSIHQQTMHNWYHQFDMEEKA